MLCTAKVQSNAESSVGLLTLAGRSARILITSTRDLGRVFTCMHDVKFDGMADFVAGIQKAQLALKHRQNLNQRQRIVVFVSSPVLAEVESLVRLGKKLKKNSVAVDVINVGLEGENVTKIDAFIEAVNSNDNSRVLHIGAGGSNLADALMNSEIYMDRASGGGSFGAGAGGDGGGASEFPHGVDPAVDPELAMVLRISMEEHRAQQAREMEGNAEGAADTGAGTGSNQPKSSGDAAGTSAGAAAAASAGYDDNDDDLYGTGDGGGEAMDVDGDDADAEMLRRAIEMSRAEAEAENPAPKGDEKKDS